MASSKAPSRSPSRRMLVLRWATVAYVVTGLLGAIGVWLAEVPDGSPPGLVSFWLGRAWGGWVAVTTVLVSLGLGRWCVWIKPLRKLDDPGWPAVMMRFVVGSFALYLPLTVLALTGGLAGPTARMVLVAVALVGLAGVALWLRERRSGVRGGAQTDSAPIAPWLRQAGVVLIALWALPFLLQTLLPDSEWDVAAYHMPIARTLLTQGLWTVDPIVPHYAFPGLVHLLYAAMLSCNAPTAIVPFNLLASFGVVAAAYALGRELWGRRAGQWAALVCLATNILWEVGLNAQIDNFLALYCILGHLAALRWMRDPSRLELLVPAAMSMGFAMGTKYTGIAFAGFLALAVVVVAILRIRQRVRATVVTLALSMLFLLIPSGVWYLRNAMVLGDPVYPYLHGQVYADTDGRFRPLRPDVEAMIASSPLTPDLKRSPVILGVDLSTVRKPESQRSLLHVWDVLLHPNHHARKALLWVSPFLLLFLGLPLAIRGRDPAAWWLYVLGLAGGLSIAALTTQTRYIVPIAPLWACGAGIVLAALPRVPRMGAGLVQLAVLLLAVQLTVNGASEAAKLWQTRPLGLFAGREADIDWLERVGYNNTPSAIVLAKWVNQEVRDGRMPAESTIFLVGEAKGDLLKARFVPDNSYEAHPWLVELLRAGGDPDRVIASFRERGINYIAVSPRFWGWALLHSNPVREHLAFALATLEKVLKPHQDRMINVGGTFVFDLGFDKEVD